MTLADPKVGGWASHELLTSPQMNLIRTELLKALDGTGGGTYTLGAPLILGGDTVRIDDELYVNAGADLVVDGTLDVNGTWRFDGTGEFNDDVNVNDRWVFRSGGQTEFKAGNAVLFFSLDDLQIGTPFVTQAMRVPLVPLFNIVDQSGFQENFVFEHTSVGGWVNAILGTSLIFMLPIMAGDVLNSVTATVAGAHIGSHGADPAQPMRLRVLEGPGSTGAYSAIATQVDAQTGAGYDAAHSLTASAGSYTALDRHYIIEWRAEASTNAIAGENVLYQLQANVTRKRLVSGNTFGS